MKKVYLLVVLFVVFFTNTNWAQVTANQPDDLLQCDDDDDGFAIFDLTQTFDQIIGDQDPFDLLIYFYETQADADINVNAIVNDISYINIVNPQNIYVRVEHTNGEFDTTSFAIIVLESPVAIQPTPLEVCDWDWDGYHEMLLSDKDLEITGNDPNLLVTYYRTQQDAEQEIGPLANPYFNQTPFFETLYVRVAHLITECVSFTTLDIIVHIPPLVTGVSDLVAYDPDGDYITFFDLTSKTSEILNGQNATVSFFETQQNAYYNENEILNPANYQNNTNPQTIYVRLENAESCISVSQFNLVAVDLLIEDDPDDMYLNEGDGDGLAIFDLTINEAQMLGGQDPEIVLFSYYITEIDSENDQNRIINPTAYQNITNPQTIYVRLSNSNSGTYLLTSFSIETDGVLGLNDSILSNLKVYPNPASEIINIQSNQLIDSAKVQLYNLQGQVVINEFIKTRNNVISLELIDLNTGIYFIKITSDEESTVKKIIIE